MKKYNEEYFSVIDKKTGKKIADCGEENDAMIMVSLDPQNRTYTRNYFLMSQVVDIEIQKTLPTTNIDIIHNTSSENKNDYIDNLLEPKPHKLPEGKGKPVKV